MRVLRRYNGSTKAINQNKSMYIPSPMFRSHKILPFSTDIQINFPRFWVTNNRCSDLGVKAIKHEGGIVVAFNFFCSEPGKSHKSSVDNLRPCPPDDWNDLSMVK
uniref:DUF1899 domain-containing protein n=1 Tax=Schistosoma curassoni TaxID=6186 RepID=A0A183KPM5_9TREM